MPKSKRDKKISLTRVSKKGLEWKSKMIADIRAAVEKYPNLFVFTTENFRNTILKELRTEWRKDSKFFFGKNRIMQIGLGKTESEELENDLHKLSARLKGQCGLLFTEKGKKEILTWAEHYEAVDYARSGFKATETIILTAGPYSEFPHSLEPHLRSLGLPTKLDKGIITLYKDHKVCEKGKILTPEQARILKLMAKPLATFKLSIRCLWNKGSGYESIQDDAVEDSEEEGDDDEDDEQDEEMADASD